MKIQVEMTAEEFQDFMSWRADKDMYERDLQKMDGKLEHLYNKVLLALEPDARRPENVKIIDQDHAAELVDMAKDWFC